MRGPCEGTFLGVHWGLCQHRRSPLTIGRGLNKDRRGHGGEQRTDGRVASMDAGTMGGGWMDERRAEWAEWFSRYFMGLIVHER